MSLETIEAALFDLLEGALVTNFTGDTHGTELIDNLSTTDGLFEGLPVFGDGIGVNSVIDTFDPVARSLTLTQPVKGSAHLSLSTGFGTASRRFQRLNDVQSFPALFLDNLGAVTEYHNIILPQTTMHLEVWIYSQAGLDPDEVPSRSLNHAAQAVLDSLGPDDSLLNQLTLGGQVQYCRVEGEWKRAQGDDTRFAMLMLPIKILLP